MTRKRTTRIVGGLGRASLAVLAPAVLSGAACNGEAPAASPEVGGVTLPTCKVRTDCPGYRPEDAGYRPGDLAVVCLFGYCDADPRPCPPLCKDHPGLTCVQSGIQAHCDGCTHDSACVSPADCETVTGHPCSPDFDGGQPPLCPGPEASCKIVP